MDWGLKKARFGLGEDDKARLKGFSDNGKNGPWGSIFIAVFTVFAINFSVSELPCNPGLLRQMPMGDGLQYSRPVQVTSRDVIPVFGFGQLCFFNPKPSDNRDDRRVH